MCWQPSTISISSSFYCSARYSHPCSTLHLVEFANLDFFFYHTSRLVRTRDPKTGDYPPDNYVILKQLEEAFNCSTRRSNSMYRLYNVKLIFQVLISGAGFLLVLGFFKDFNETFICPSLDSDTLSSSWPLPYEQVVCVFASFDLMHKIWVTYLLLLGIAMFFLVLAFLWLAKNHPSELGIYNDCFETSIPLHHYVSQLSISTKLEGTWFNKIMPSYSFKSPYSIQSDYDFLLIKLFRTEGGLAYVLREIHLLRLLNSLELGKIHINITQLRSKGIYPIVIFKVHIFS